VIICLHGHSLRGAHFFRSFLALDYHNEFVKNNPSRCFNIERRKKYDTNSSLNEEDGSSTAFLCAKSRIASHGQQAATVSPHNFNQRTDYSLLQDLGTVLEPSATSKTKSSSLVINRAFLAKHSPGTKVRNGEPPPPGDGGEHHPMFSQPLDEILEPRSIERMVADPDSVFMNTDDGTY
jgi:hypothetical protein